MNHSIITMSKKSFARQIAEASSKNTWDNLGEAAAHKLGFQPEKGEHLFQLCQIVQRLGGFLFPIAGLLRRQKELPWIDVRGPKDFTIYVDLGLPNPAADIIRALYYYLAASKHGQKPLQSNNDDFNRDYYAAERFTAGFLVPIRTIEKNPAGDAHLIVSTSEKSRATQRFVEIRLDSLGLLTETKAKAA